MHGFDDGGSAGKGYSAVEADDFIRRGSISVRDQRCGGGRVAGAGGCGVAVVSAVSFGGLLLLLLLLELAAIRFLVPLPFAVGTLLVVRVSPRLVLLSLGEKGGRVASRLRDPVVFFSDDLVDDPPAADFGRVRTG